MVARNRIFINGKWFVIPLPLLNYGDVMRDKDYREERLPFIEKIYAPFDTFLLKLNARCQTFVSIMNIYLDFKTLSVLL